MVVEELTPEMIWDRLNNSKGQYRDSFSYDGICAIFEYFENIEYDREYEFYDIVYWDSMFYEADSPEDLLKKLKPAIFDEYEYNYSKDEDYSEKCYKYIEDNYMWSKNLGNGHVIVYHER